MSLLISTKSKVPSKVHHSEYIRTENKPEEETAAPKPSEQPEPDSK